MELDIIKSPFFRTLDFSAPFIVILCSVLSIYFELLPASPILIHGTPSSFSVKYVEIGLGEAPLFILATSPNVIHDSLLSNVNIFSEILLR